MDIYISFLFHLAAAHCVAGNRKGILQGLYVGAYSPFNGNSGYPYHFSTPQSIVIHPNFNATTDTFDVAMIRLQSCVDTSQFAPATVATVATLDKEVVGAPVTTMGFGRLSSNSNVQVETLQSVNLDYYDTNTCNDFYQPYGNTVYHDMICAGVPSGGKDACQGDSGGPLVITNTSTLLGVVSWGRGCAVANFPGVYNSVAAHYTWIQAQVCSDTGVILNPLPLALCIDFASRISESIPRAAPAAGPSTTIKVPPRPPPTRRPTFRPTFRPTTRTAFCAQNVNGDFTYTTSAGSVITMACSSMVKGQLGHTVCSVAGATRTCPKACNPVCQP
jgi:hypothetical protein